MKCPFDKKDESCFYRHPTTKDCSLDRQMIVCPDYLETLPCKGRLSNIDNEIKLSINSNDSWLNEFIKSFSAENEYIRGHYHVGCDIGKEKKMETKTYPHKFFVQFSRDWFSVKSGKMLQYKTDDGKEHSIPETIFNRLITFCVINPIDTAEYYEGMSVLNPKDHQNDLVGAKEAFQRALDEAWIKITQSLWYTTEQLISKDTFKKIFFDAFLKKNFTSDNILSNGGFVLKVRLPWENKRR